MSDAYPGGREKRLMEQARNGSSFQALGNGVFRAGGAVHRSALTGRYVSSTSSSRRTGEASEKHSSESSPDTR